LKIIFIYKQWIYKLIIDSTYCFANSKKYSTFAVRNIFLLYSISIEKVNKINKLLLNAYPGKLYFSSWLKENGYFDQLLKQYRNSGWLSALSKGVMYRTGDKPLAYPALSCYNLQLGKSFHVSATK
jgi:hypothetical protein